MGTLISIRFTTRSKDDQTKYSVRIQRVHKSEPKLFSCSQFKSRPAGRVAVVPTYLTVVPLVSSLSTRMHFHRFKHLFIDPLLLRNAFGHN